MDKVEVLASGVIMLTMDGQKYIMSNEEAIEMRNALTTVLEHYKSINPNQEKEKEMATKNEERMRWALEDVEKYVEQLEVARDTMASVSQMLMDTPGADDAVKASDGFVAIYEAVSRDLRRLTNRGLSRDV